MIDLRSADAGEDWRQTVKDDADCFQASMQLHASIERLRSRDGDALVLLRRALHSRERPAAIYVASQLDVAYVKELLPELVHLASFDHPDLARVRDTILKVPRRWLPARVEAIGRDLLEGADDGIYRRLLELYALIDFDGPVAEPRSWWVVGSGRR